MRRTWRPGSRIDFFISYRSDASRHATWASEIVEGAGFSTAVQVKDFRPDDDFARLIDEALRSCSWLLALLTPSYFSSMWCRDEWEEASLRGKLITAQLEPCGLDEAWSELVDVDLVGLDADPAGAALLQVVRSKPLPWGGRAPRIASAERVQEMSRNPPWRDRAEIAHNPQTRPGIDIGPGASHEARKIAQRRFERGDF